VFDTALIPEAIALMEQNFAQSNEHPEHREKISKKEFIDVCIRHGSAAASWKDSLHHSGATKVPALPGPPFSAQTSAHSLF
jgi:hypothetical protein